MALSELQVRKQMNMFNAFDADKDGVLEASDFEAFSQRIIADQGLQPGTPAYNAVQGRWQAFWTRLSMYGDKNHNHRVAADEWLAMHEGLSELEKNQAATLYFSVLDTDGDHKITRDEYRRLYRIMGMDETLADVVFPMFDQNNDGYVTYEEHIQIVAEYHGDDPNAPGNWLFGKV